MPTSFFAQPHHFERSLHRRLKRAMLVGLFIALFLGIFQPFGLGTLPNSWTLAGGYGLVTLLAMAMLDLVLTGLRIDPERWTLGRELLSYVANILLIGLLNAAYSAWQGFATMQASTIAIFTLYTLLVGFFPVTAMVLVGFQRSKVHYVKESETINAGLDAPAEPEVQPVRRVVLVGENQNEKLEVAVDDLFYLKSADNYVEVHHRRNELERSVLRGSLRFFQDQLQDHPAFLRCHKSHVVNLDRVVRVSGNAQGLRLHLEGDLAEVPVSRSLTEEVRARLAVHPRGPSHSSLGVPVAPAP
jgi:hypothetical protein